MTTRSITEDADAAQAADLAIRRQAALYRAAVMEHISEGEPYVLAGFPDHSNSGDSAIYLGELKLFDELRCDLRYVCSKDAYRGDPLKVPADGTLFLHGGGNLGDLYGENNFRHLMLSHFAKRKIVQLPQTIHFRKEAEIDRMARAIDDHGDFHLMVRDRPSYDLARARFDCPVTMVPDAAYYLGRLEPTRRTRHSFLSIQRTDTEKASDAMSTYLASLGPVRDWRGKTAPFSHYLWVAKKHARQRLTSLPAREASDMAYRKSSYARRAWDRVNIAVDVLSAARAVISDRLHAHILSSLLRKPHAALDNNYGKISSYISLWGNDGLALVAQDLDQLKAAVGHLRSGATVPLLAGDFDMAQAGASRATGTAPGVHA